ncbi:MAG: ubiquinol-cytochrome c reductase iron-sulfur subunit [Phormidesmis sp.]
MKRRDFMNWIGVGAIAASLPVAIAACTPEADETTTIEEDAAPSEADTAAPPTDSASADGFIALGTTAELEAQGSLTSEDAFSEPVVVIQDPADPEALIALSAKCTHAGCTVAWQEDLFACPCHGSKFNPDGTVSAGPADAPLAKYTAKVEGDSVMVSAA